MPCCGGGLSDVVPDKTDEHIKTLSKKGLKRCKAPELCVPMERRSPVRLNIYDLSTKNKTLRKVGFGIYHVGVIVFGIEWSFGEAVDNTDGTGLFYCPPGCAGYVFRSELVGYTTLSPVQVDTILHRLENEWRSREYHILHRNCNHFAQRLCDLLSTVEPLKVPAWCNRAARVADTVVPRKVAVSIQHKVSGGSGPPKSKVDRRSAIENLPHSVIPAGWYTNPIIVQPPKFRYNIGGVFTSWSDGDGGPEADRFSPTSRDSASPQVEGTLGSRTSECYTGTKTTFPNLNEVFTHPPHRVQWQDEEEACPQEDEEAEEPHLQHETGLTIVSTPPTSPTPRDAQDADEAFPGGDGTLSHIQSAALDCAGSPADPVEKVPQENQEKYFDPDFSQERSPQLKHKSHPGRRGRRFPKIRWHFNVSQRQNGKSTADSSKKKYEDINQSVLDPSVGVDENSDTHTR